MRDHTPHHEHTRHQSGERYYIKNNSHRIPKSREWERQTTESEGMMKKYDLHSYGGKPELKESTRG